MITGISIENFRSIESADLPLGKINVFTGANNSGKSSVIYALMVYKSFMDNPNRTLDQILTLPFISLGPFNEIVFSKDEKREISIGLNCIGKNIPNNYKIESKQKLALHPAGSTIYLEATSPLVFQSSIEIPLPYSLNKMTSFNYTSEKGVAEINWNGFTAQVQQFNEPKGSKTHIDFEDLQSKMISSSTFPKTSSEHLMFAPIERGFKRPFYGAVPLGTNQVYTEDEIATSIAQDHDLAGRIAHYLEKIVNRYFVVNALLGTSSFRLQTRDKENGFTTDLVNEGLGTNQLVTLLAKILDKNTWTTCIDEPEIHLHPSIIEKFIASIVDIAAADKKQFIFSTHSEHLVQSLLTQVREGKIKPENVNIYYTKKNKKKTEFERQLINSKGQIEGGLKSFYEEELKNVQDFFKVD